jgi:hypothetical protein
VLGKTAPTGSQQGYSEAPSGPIKIFIPGGDLLVNRALEAVLRYAQRI